MKRQLMILMVSLLIGNSSLFAQEDSLVTLPEITVTGSTKVSNELNSAFSKAFPEAENVHWYKVDKDYLSTFIQNDMDHNALFKKNKAKELLVNSVFFVKMNTQCPFKTKYHSDKYNRKNKLKSPPLSKGG